MITYDCPYGFVTIPGPLFFARLHDTTLKSYCRIYTYIVFLFCFLSTTLLDHNHKAEIAHDRLSLPSPQEENGGET